MHRLEHPDMPLLGGRGGPIACEATRNGIDVFFEGTILTPASGDRIDKNTLGILQDTSFKEDCVPLDPFVCITLVGQL